MSKSDAHWVRSPVTTRHAQAALLWISFTWGLSYCMPQRVRIPFSEVYPPGLDQWSFIPMAGYGLGMILAALAALVGERLIVAGDGYSRPGWALSWISHTVLCSIYFTLALGSVAAGAKEIRWDNNASLTATIFVVGIVLLVRAGRKTSTLQSSAVDVGLAVVVCLVAWLRSADTVGALVSASSRPVLWSYVAWLHTTYARLPRPIRIEDVS